MLQIDLSQYLTQEAIVRAFENMPELKTPVMDTIYTARRNHPLPVVATSEIQQAVQNVAVVKRGGNPTPIYDGGKSITYIEPQPLKPSEVLNGVDINNLKMLQPDSVEQYVNNKIDRIRRSVRMSSEAIAAQSLSGTISYPMDMGGGAYGLYEVDFGDTLTYTLSPSKLWDASDINIKTVLQHLTEMSEKVKSESQYGSTIVFWAGKKAFYALSQLVMAISNDSRGVATVSATTINFFGFIIELQTGSYVSDIAAGTKTKIVADNKIVAIATDAPFELIYAAVDDIEAGLIGTPLALKQFVDGRSSSIEIIGESKPLPVPFTKGICWATVAS